MKRQALLTGLAMVAALSTLNAGKTAQPRKQPTPSSPQVIGYHQNIDVQLDDEVHVRTMYLPPAYDDKGNPRRYTSAEYKKLKGTDSRQPGYESDFSNLKVGQTVTIALGHKKDDKPAGDDRAESKSATTNWKSAWVPMGDIAGSIVKLDDTGKKITLRLESIALKGAGKLDSTTTKAIMADRIGYQIVILSKDPGQK